MKWDYIKGEDSALRVIHNNVRDIYWMMGERYFHVHNGIEVYAMMEREFVRNPINIAPSIVLRRS